MLTLNLASGAPSPQTGTLTFQQTNGMKYTVSYPVSITVPANANRTITFTNYCTSPLGSTTGVGTTGSDVVIALTSSSVPAVSNPASQNITCPNGNSDCSIFSYSSCVSGSGQNIQPCPNGGAGCYCGAGACTVDADCNNIHAGTCTTAQPGTPSSCTYCANNADCIVGSTCNTTTHKCYWTLPVPQKNGATHYELSAYTLGSQNPDSATIAIPDNSSSNGYTLEWGGSFSGSVGCTKVGNTYTNCTVGDCTRDGNGACTAGIGAQQPSTNAEATFVVLSYDTYDVTLDNGATNAISMYPTPGSAATPQAYSNPYMCGFAGAPFQVDTNRGSVGQSNWDTFTLPKSTQGYTIYDFQWVDGVPGTPCTAESCGAGKHCGLTSANLLANSSTTTCGTLLGYWSPQELCQYDVTPNFPNFPITDSNGNVVVSCSNQYGANKYSELAGCNGSNGAATSCFSVSAPSSSCGGCATWSNLGILVPTDTSVVAACKYPNAYWVGNGTTRPGVLPYITWLKQTCPSCYVFSFDDKTSTFNCPESGQSAVNYNIDFCPQNKGLTPA